MRKIQHSKEIICLLQPFPKDTLTLTKLKYYPEFTQPNLTYPEMKITIIMFKWCDFSKKITKIVISSEKLKFSGCESGSRSLFVVSSEATL